MPILWNKRKRLHVLVMNEKCFGESHVLYWQDMCLCIFHVFCLQILSRMVETQRGSVNQISSWKAHLGGIELLGYISASAAVWNWNRNIRMIIQQNNKDSFQIYILYIYIYIYIYIIYIYIHNIHIYILLLLFLIFK